MFSGINIVNLEFYNDMYLFDILNSEWKPITPTGTPLINLVLHSMCNFDDQIYLFGGSGITVEETFFNNFYKVNFN